MTQAVRIKEIIRFFECEGDETAGDKQHEYINRKDASFIKPRQNNTYLNVKSTIWFQNTPPNSNEEIGSKHNNLTDIRSDTLMYGENNSPGRDNFNYSSDTEIVNNSDVSTVNDQHRDNCEELQMTVSEAVCNYETLSTKKIIPCKTKDANGCKTKHDQEILLKHTPVLAEQLSIEEECTQLKYSISKKVNDMFSAKKRKEYLQADKISIFNCISSNNSRTEPIEISNNDDTKNEDKYGWQEVNNSSAYSSNESEIGDVENGMKLPKPKPRKWRVISMRKNISAGEKILGFAKSSSFTKNKEISYFTEPKRHIEEGLNDIMNFYTDVTDDSTIEDKYRWQEVNNSSAYSSNESEISDVDVGVKMPTPKPRKWKVISIKKNILAGRDILGFTNSSSLTENIEFNDFSEHKRQLEKGSSKIMLSSVETYQKNPTIDLGVKVVNRNLEHRAQDTHGLETSDILGKNTVYYLAKKNIEWVKGQLCDLKKSQMKRIDELLSTERTFVSQLRQFIRFYGPCLQQAGAPRGLARLEPEDLFCHIKLVYKLHGRTLLPALLRARGDVRALGNVFIDNENKLMVYESYSSKKYKSNEIIQKHKKYFDKIEENSGYFNDILTHLTYPMQRLTKFPLFLKTLVKNQKEMIRLSRKLSKLYSNLPPTSMNMEEIQEPHQTKFCEDGLESLQKALDGMLNVIAVINVSMTLQSIHGLPITLKQPKNFMRRDTFRVTDILNNHRKMECFLFRTSIILTILHQKVSMGNHYTYVDSIPMDKLLFTGTKDGGEPFFTVQHYTLHLKKYIFKGEKATQKAWEDDITQLLWTQMHYLRELKKSSSSSTGNSPLSVSQSDGSFFESDDDSLNRFASEQFEELNYWKMLETEPKNELVVNDERNLQECVDELVYRENEYTRNLQQLWSHVLWDVSRFSHIPKHILKNTRDIYVFHSEEMLPALKSAGYDLCALGEVLSKNREKFEMYKNYSNKNDISFDIVNQHTYLCREILTQLGKNHILCSFFHNPFHIIATYRRALEDLIRICLNFCELINVREIGTYAECNELKSLEKFKKHKDFIEKLQEDIEDTMSMERIKYSRVNLMLNGKIIRNGDFHVVNEQSEELNMRCFLLQKVLIFTTIHIEDLKEYYYFYDSIDLRALGITSSEDKKSRHFTVWYKNINGKRYKLLANHLVVSDWVNEINKILWAQMVTEKEKLRIIVNLKKKSIAAY